MKKRKLGYLLNTITVIVAVLVIGSGFVAYSYNTLVMEAKNYIGEMADLSSENIAQSIAVNMRTMESFATYFSERELSEDREIIAMLMDEVSLSGGSVVRYSYANYLGEGYTVRSNGVVNRIDVEEYPYFKRAMRGQVLITPTLEDTVTGTPVNIYSMPVFSDNIIVGAHMAVASATQLESSLIGSDFMDGNGHAYIVNSEGERVIDGSYTSDGVYRPFRDIGIDSLNIGDMRRLIEGGVTSSAFDIKNTAGDTYWIAYRPVGVNDWYLMLAVPYTYVTGNAKVMLLISLLVFIAALVGTLAFVRYLNYLKRENSLALYRIAYLDALTGLYNRDGFTLKVSELFSGSARRYAVVYVDLDNFRAINELFGYDKGTDLLETIGGVVSAEVDSDEVGARLGDKFALLIKYRSDDEITMRASRLLEGIGRCSLGGDGNTLYNIITCIGVYKTPRNPEPGDIDSYIDRATMAISALKENHQKGFAFFDNVLQERLRFEAELEKDMPSALQDKDFKVYVQPKYRAKDGKLAGGEALIRWQHKTKGFLTPFYFVPLFEKNGMVTKLDMYVYDFICQAQADLIKRGYTPVTISVNQSRLHLYRAGYMDRLRFTLDKYKLPPEYIEVEVTENIALASGKVLKRAIEGWHQLGFKVAMDDFGSGESSLNLLKDIDIDVLKLDKNFFSKDADEEKASIIIKSIIDMAKQLNISTVAEGVDSNQQLEFLKEAGCDLIQGYLLGKPMPYEEFEELLITSQNQK